MTLHLVLPVILPLGGAALSLLCRRSTRVQRLIGLACCGGLLVYLAAALWPLLGRLGHVTLRIGNWPAPYGIVLAADLLAGIMLSLTAVVGLVVLAYAAAWLRDQPEESLFYPLYLVLLMGVNGAFLTGDIFNLYVFFEVTLVSSFALLALGGTRPQLEGAIKYLALSQVSSALFLIGAGLLYGIAGTLNMADLARKLALPGAAPYTAVLALVLLGAFGIKAAVFPLFFWLPASYHVARTPVSAIFGGLLAEVGVYALYRSYTLLFPGQWLAQRGLLLGIAALTMLVGVLGAVAQNDVKRLLAFDVISQVGYLVMGLGFGSPLAIAAGLYFMMHIVLVKTSLFLLAGLAERITGSSDLRAMGGLLRRQPLLSALFLGAALALAGVPPLSGFYAKLGLVWAGLELEQYGAVAAALATSLLTLYVMARVWGLAFMDKRPADTLAHSAAPLGLFVPAAALTTLAVLAALLAAPLYAVAEGAAAQLSNSAPYLLAVLGG